jgi:hypothetical protein
MRVFLGILAGALLLSACASVSREECLAGDWAAIGARDGADGRLGETQFNRHVAACAKVDITPDRTAWAAGYEAGLRQYCTPQTGLRVGEAGRIYQNVCPAASEPAFLRGHELGLAAYRQRQRIAEIEREISSLRSESSGLLRAGAEAPPEWHSTQSERLALQLDLMVARSDLLRIEREIRAFRAAL